MIKKEVTKVLMQGYAIGDPNAESNSVKRGTSMGDEGMFYVRC